jgi:signal peptidase II
MKLSRLALLAYGLAAAVIALDQAVKYWFLTAFHLQVGESAQLLGPLRLSMVENKGVSFGVLNLDSDAARWPLTIFAFVVAGVLAWWAARVEKPLLAVAVGLIMGGAVGNAIDRVHLGYVVDFIDAQRLFFPWVFNIADSAITIGSVLLIWDLFLAPRKRAPG